LFVGLTAAVLAVSSIMILAGPAGAANACDESMNPAASGNSSGLIVACTFDSTGTASTISITDYDDALWHYGAARNVNVTVQRTNSSTAGKTTIKSRPTNNTATASCVNSPAGQTGIPAGNLQISAADINHSVEFASSNTNHTGKFINPGTFIKTVVASGSGCTKVITVTLSKATLAGGPLCPASPGPATGNCTNSVGANVLVSNDTGRTVTDGVTSAGSATVTSASGNFKAGDVGARVSGGDLPDGATISTVNSTTSITLICTGCVGGFTGVTSHTAQVISLAPANAPTSARYVTDVTAPGTNKVITSPTAEFANTDVGLPVTIQTNTGGAIALPGARIASVAADGSTATLSAASNVPATAKRAVIGLATKTAPATNDVAGYLAILLKVNPTVSPTSPPCAADKVSGFQIPLLWKNPGQYNTTVSGGTNQFSGTSPAATSIAQFDFNTASTSFSGYLEQHYTTTASVAGPSSYTIHYTFLPITVGLCPGTGDATTFNFGGLSLKIAQNPSFTGGGGGGERGILPEPQGTSTNYTGATGAQVTTGAANQPTNSNSCTVSSPSLLVVGC
jgi:hypothetical protein